VTDETPDYPPPPRSEAHWPPQLAIAIAVALQFLLPSQLNVGPRWLVPGIETLMLISLVAASPQRIEDRHRRRRRIALILSCLTGLANGVSLVLLSHYLLRNLHVDGHALSGHALILSGALIWLTNVLVFSLWYWEIDRGGPGTRAAGHDGPPDFLFPQMTEPGLFEQWRPQFPDYLYVSLTNAAAFSPTDTMPTGIQVKMLMGLQSLVSLVTIGLIISRAVNIL
jgi:uncharacterized membrane protein